MTIDSITPDSITPNSITTDSITTNTQPKTIQCPTCRVSVEWNSTSACRPFCSERCKNRDFGSWANEEHVLQGSAVYDDVLSEQLILD